MSPGARARVNYDSRHGTVVIARAGTSDVRTPDGSYSRAGRASTSMVEGGEEPEIERGAFSRDRFDIWAADRLPVGHRECAASRRSTSTTRTRATSWPWTAYGDWSYNDTYGGNVWRPRVAADWTPYSNGILVLHAGRADLVVVRSVGLVSLPLRQLVLRRRLHAAGAGRRPTSTRPRGSTGDTRRATWAGAPSASTPYYSPGGTPTTASGDGIGRTSTWRCTERSTRGRWTSADGTSRTAAASAAAGRAEVIAGSRVGDRLGSQVAISSRPIVVSARPGEAREAVSNWVREAPRVIERASGPDSSRLAPILARERALPASAVEAMRERAVVADRGRLTGPAAGDVAPRGVAVERARPTVRWPRTPGLASASVAPSLAPAAPSQGLEPSRGLARPDGIARPVGGDSWRFRGRPVEAAARLRLPRSRRRRRMLRTRLPRRVPPFRKRDRAAASRGPLRRGGAIAAVPRSPSRRPPSARLPGRPTRRARRPSSLRRVRTGVPAPGFLPRAA